MAMIELTPGYLVSPQIAVEEVPALAEAGISLVICNRPDAEVPPSHQSPAMEEAVRAAGMAFAYLPVTHHGLTLDEVARQAELTAGAGGPVLAYCNSGTRSTIVWALGQAGHRETDAILATAAKAGYQLDGLRPTLDALAQERG
ncbi:TIGR01244 family sulfur transferase [Salipiger sp. P9]|uniref:TIGR01244 family sulfur transferase n=1 Tax=Salipiger pentaromativorans TaxID=2943193 RepID=UPI002158466C|nr:TIGR01244 family sulfur transferase [Salipiger pentaromativorans]MCR8550284.1 TIGR01244 family sulfur transferase [Salipiger pentaromativorans]